MTRLPAWADNAEARALLSGIIANPPETRQTSGAWIEGGGQTVHRSWKRPDVAALKQLHQRWLDREIAALDVQFAVTGKWCDEAAHAVLGAERPDDLIGRLLVENAEQFVEVEHLAPGRIAA